VLPFLLLVKTRVARVFGGPRRRLAGSPLGERVAPPPAFRPAAASLAGRRHVRDGQGWRAVAYQLLAMLVAVLEGYACHLWFAGFADLSYPFWWELFRNHPPGAARPGADVHPVPEPDTARRHVRRYVSCVSCSAPSSCSPHHG